MGFSETELVKCGTMLAAHLNLRSPPDGAFRIKINEILLERQNYEGAKKGLITKEETASLVLQHFQTLICNFSNVSESEINISWKPLVPDTIEALFKHEIA